MSTTELTDNLTFLSALQMLRQLTQQGLLTDKVPAHSAFALIFSGLQTAQFWAPLLVAIPKWLCYRCCGIVVAGKEANPWQKTKPRRSL